MRRVCIDPGHGGDQPGAVYDGLEEKNINLGVAERVIEQFPYLDPEIWACLTRTCDQTLSLQQRCDFSNNMNVDCFVSIHCNADPDPDESGMPEARGEEIWIFKGSAGGLRLAKCLAAQVDRIFPGEPFRGIKETENLYVLKHTIAPAALIEIGFIDKSSSIEAFSDSQTVARIGGLIARGIFNFFNSR